MRDVCVGRCNALFHSLKTPFVSSHGFTLVELVVAFGAIGILLGIAIFAIRPNLQFEKARDSERRREMQEIKKALETYYSDNECYPSSLPYGEEWVSEEGAVYMQETPNGPSCDNDDSSCSEYSYMYDSVAEVCPQWYILFSKKEYLSSTVNELDCPLESLQDCTPIGYLWTQYLCTFEGNIACEDVSSRTIEELSSSSQMLATNACMK